MKSNGISQPIIRITDKSVIWFFSESGSTRIEAVLSLLRISRGATEAIDMLCFHILKNGAPCIPIPLPQWRKRFVPRKHFPDRIALRYANRWKDINPSWFASCPLNTFRFAAFGNIDNESGIHRQVKRWMIRLDPGYFRMPQQIFNRPNPRITRVLAVTFPVSTSRSVKLPSGWMNPTWSSSINNGLRIPCAMARGTPCSYNRGFEIFISCKRSSVSWYVQNYFRSCSASAPSISRQLIAALVKI